jgi:hypothetical protein
MYQDGKNEINEKGSYELPKLNPLVGPANRPQKSAVLEVFCSVE